MVASGIGLAIRADPDPNAPALGQLRFAQVVATTGEASGADGKPWRRLESGGWASREALLIFPTVREAVSLMVELRVYSSPELRRAAPVGPRAPLPTPMRAPASAGRATVGPSPTPAPTPTRTPTPTVTPSPTATRAPTATPRTTPAPQPVSRPSYGVVVRDETIQYLVPGRKGSHRPPLDVGAGLALVAEGVGADGQRYLRTEEDLWVLGSAVRVFATLNEMTEAAYRATMEALAPAGQVDPDVLPALWLLHREPEFRYLADTIAESAVPIRVGPLGDQSLIATYSFADGAITISDRYIAGDIRVLAVALAHEATHAWERKQGLRLTSTADCLEAELRAFRNQAALWEKFYGPNGKEKPSSQGEIEQNEVLRLVKQDPDALKRRLLSRYGDQCGYHGPLPGTTAAAGTAPPPQSGATPAPKPVATTAARRPYGLPPQSGVVTP